MAVVIETTIGDFTVDLYVKERPRTSMNFLKLCKMKAYNTQMFFKVTPNFVCQAGDPTNSGRGGESIFRHLYGDQARFFEAEKRPRLKHLKLGTLSMIDNGEGMLGSQFLITLSVNLDYLDEQHCVFGEVVEGFEFLEKINNVICDKNERPLQDIRITHTVVLDDPFDEPENLEYPSSPEVTLEDIKSDRIACYESIDDFEGKTAEEINELMREKEAKAQATILEIIGDLPDADMAPPENVLFVCKLNPVTSDDDLELIFSRFGEIKSCEVIRDWKSGESLQYAFIEFAQKESCEQAYFKMDNVLIDDRRIHVDFSQSVAKVKWKGKGRGVVGSWTENDRTKDAKFSSKSGERYKIKDTKKKKDDYQLILDDGEDKRRSRENTRDGKTSRSPSSRHKQRRNNLSPKGRRSRSLDTSHRSKIKRSRSRSRQRARQRDRDRERKFTKDSQAKKHKRSRSRDARSNRKEEHVRRKSRSQDRSEHHSRRRH